MDLVSKIIMVAFILLPFVISIKKGNPAVGLIISAFIGFHLLFEYEMDPEGFDFP